MWARDTYHRLNGEIVKIAPVTMPALALPPLDVEAIEAEAAAKIKTIRLGRDAWQQIARAQSFDGWKAIGAALAVGKAHALRITQANAPWGRNYSREFNLWVRQHGFEKMPAATRGVAVELHEHAEAITAWRDTLPERHSLTHGNGKSSYGPEARR